MTDKPSAEIGVHISTLVSAQTGQGIVCVKWGRLDTQLPAADARAVAMNLLQAAEASLGDEMLVRALKSIEMDEPAIYTIIRLYRNARAEWEEHP